MWPKRYTPVVLCFLAAFLAYTDRVNLPVAVIAMQAEFGWTETTRGFVLAASISVAGAVVWLRFATSRAVIN